MEIQNCTWKEYIASKSSTKARILAIENLIDLLLLETIDSIEDAGVVSFMMDDGQVKVNTEYRSITDISAGVFALERIKNLYINKKNGHVTILRGRKNY